MTATTLVDHLCRWSRETPDRIAFVQLDREGRRTRHLDFATLAAAVEGARDTLATRLRPGERVLLAPEDGIDFAVGLLACLAARVTAVPIARPRRDDGWDDVVAIARHAKAHALLDGHGDRRDPPRDQSPIADAAGAIAVLSLPSEVEVDTHDGGAGALAGAARADDVAVLQYTSGSIRAPKGVVVDNAALVAMADRVVARSAIDPTSTVLGWSPLHHVTGLVSTLSAPVRAGCTAVLLPTAAFATDPILWLEAITIHRATHSGGPAFAYDLCTRASPARARLEGLDLRRWEVAFVAAEPVRAEVLDAFARTFAPAGFASRAFQACYGLSEAIRVATSALATAPRVLRVDARDLRDGIATVAQPDVAGATRLVGHGPLVHDDVTITIVDPVTRVPVPPMRVGEIWISGAGIARGYADEPALTNDVFGAMRPGTTDRHLRTGDLGFTDGTDLFIAGRATEMIIVRGRNIHPEDVESTVARADDRIDAGAVVVFGIDAGAAEEIVVLAETNAPDAELDVVHTRARVAIARRHGIPVRHLGLAARGSIPRTSSGKLSRRQTRAAYAAGVLAERSIAIARSATPETETETETERALQRIWTTVLRSDVPIPTTTSLDALGSDSLTTMQLLGAMRANGFDVPALALEGSATIGGLASTLPPRASRHEVEGVATEATEATEPTGPIPLLPSQARFLHTYDALRERREAEGRPDANFFYTTIPKFFVLDHPIDAPSLRAAARLLLARHAALRTCFARVDGTWRARVIASVEPNVDVRIDDRSRRDGEARFVETCADAIARWDIGTAPLMRFCGATFRDESVLMVATHHMVSDNVSERVLVEELLAAYTSARSGTTLTLPRQTTSITAWASDLAPPRATGGAAPPRASRARSPDAKSARRVTMLPLHVSGDVVAAVASKVYAGSAFDLCCTAFLAALRPLARRGDGLDISHHGRPIAGERADLSRTVGLFACDIALPIAEDGAHVPSLARDAVLETRRRLRGLADGARAAAREVPARPYLPARFGLNYQRLGVGASAPGVRMLDSRYRGLVAERLGPRAYAFFDLHFEGQIRTFLLDQEGAPLRCVVNHPLAALDEAAAAALVRAFDAELRRLLEGARPSTAPAPCGEPSS